MIPTSFNSALVLASLKASTKTPVDPKMKMADCASCGPVYSIAWYCLLVSFAMVSQISDDHLKISAELTGRTLEASTVVAAELRAWLSALLSRRDDPTEEVSWLNDAVVVGSVEVGADSAVEGAPTVSSETVGNRPASA